jgi:hypothetical protein
VGWGSSNPKKAEEKPQIPLDIASYKLYYVNYEMRLTKATLVHLTKHETSHSPTWNSYFFSGVFPDFCCASS